MNSSIALGTSVLLCLACSDATSQGDSSTRSTQFAGGSSAMGGSRAEGGLGAQATNTGTGERHAEGGVSPGTHSNARGGTSSSQTADGANLATTLPKGEPVACVAGSRPGTVTQTLVFVRHAETMANICEDACSDGTCCESNVCATGCDDDCNCEANLTSFSPKGATGIGETLVNRLKALNLGWDRIIVSPSWRTQTTIKAYLEAESLCGQIVPELEECWNEDSGTCSTPPWESEPYSIIGFAGGTLRLVPRAYSSKWDPVPSNNTQRSYDHSGGNAQCESIIISRAYEYIEGLFEDGAMTVLSVTHAMTGEALLARLTGTSDYSLENAPAYTVLTRSPGSKNWRVQVSNAK